MPSLQTVVGWSISHSPGYFYLFASLQLRERMPSVSGSWEVYDVSASIICSSSMRSSSTGCWARMCTTSTEPGRIKGSSSRFQSHKLGQCHQIPKAARSSPSRSWVGSIMTIEEVHKFLRISEDVTARGMRRVPTYVQRINRQFLVIYLDEGNKQDRCMLYST